VTPRRASECPPIREALPPCAESVVGLARLAAGQPAAEFRTLLLRDPGLLLYYLTEHLPQLPSSSAVYPPAAAEAPLAHRMLRDLSVQTIEPGMDWTGEKAGRAFRLGQAASRLARWLALKCQIDADRAEIGGLLSPLGLLAAAGPCGKKLGGLAPGKCTRFLARRWPLPPWLAATLLSLDLTEEAAARLGAERRLTLVVQAALGLSAAADTRLATQHTPEEAISRLGGGPDLLADARHLLKQPTPSPPDGDVARSFANLLRLALPAQAPRVPPVAAREEIEAEKLRVYLAEQQSSEAERLRQAKLRALAEFAAGAGHEINNPLAVISGQAQYLLRTEESPERIHSLRRIVAQAQRIHEILKSLMFFARPPVPARRRVEVGMLARQAAGQLLDLCEEREVSISMHLGAGKLAAVGDAALLTAAIAALLKNAVEASPRGGMVRLIGKRCHAVRIELAVEDDGPGLTPAQKEHLFDPFYSGRQAGRGLGLGLSKAWRIAELHGGSIVFRSEPGQPTRFVLTLPASPRPAIRSPKPSVNGNGVPRSNHQARQPGKGRARSPRRRGLRR